MTSTATKPLHIDTPLIESRKLSSLNGKSVWLKMDAMQPPGSFKIRGIGLACQEYIKGGARHLISSSGGNAGIAVAYAGRQLGVPVTVVVPETTTERAKDLILQEEAKLIVHGSSWQEANELAQSMVSDNDAFLHPFDDPIIWRGHATMIDEVVQSGLNLKPDVVVLSAGGGGLYCGVIEGLRRNGLSDVPVLVAETYGADSFAQAIKAGHRIELDSIKSIATSLGARMICEQAMKLSTEHPTHSAVVADLAAVRSCERFLDDHRVLVEPACGASLALAYDGALALDSFATIIIVVCGGVTATLEQIQIWARSLN